jgi:UDP-N-acetylmuramoyl-tripeptide--D-alanyl-D-alanine ligase
MGHAHRKKMAVRVIGITGSNGKTTTKEMLAHLLRGMGRRVLDAGKPEQSDRVAPDAVGIGTPSHPRGAGNGRLGERRHRAFVRNGHAPNGGHHGNRAGAFGNVRIVGGRADAKWELVEALGKDGIAFLNGTIRFCSCLEAKRARCSVVTFGQTIPRSGRSSGKCRQDPRTVFDLVVGGARREVRLPLAGLFNVTNAWRPPRWLCGSGGFCRPWRKQLGRFSPPPQRMQMRRRPDGSLFLIDAYNANPDSMAASLASFVSAFPHWPRPWSWEACWNWARLRNRNIDGWAARWPGCPWNGCILSVPKGLGCGPVIRRSGGKKRNLFGGKPGKIAKSNRRF